MEQEQKELWVTCRSYRYYINSYLRVHTSTQRARYIALALSALYVLVMKRWLPPPPHFLYWLLPPTLLAAMLFFSWQASRKARLAQAITAELRQQELIVRDAIWRNGTTSTSTETVAEIHRLCGKADALDDSTSFRNAILSGRRIVAKRELASGMVAANFD